MKAFWTYTALRIGLFLATAAVLFGVSLLIFDRISLLLVVVVAAVISSALSWKLLSAPRERFAANVDARASRAAHRFEEVRAKEDAEAQAEHSPGSSPATNPGTTPASNPETSTGTSTGTSTAKPE